VSRQGPSRGGPTAATPSTRPSALVGPPQSGRLRKRGSSTRPAATTPSTRPHTQSPGSRGIGECPVRDRAEGVRPQLPPRLGLRRSSVPRKAGDSVGGCSSVGQVAPAREKHPPRLPPRLGLIRNPPVSGGSVSVPSGIEPRGPRRSYPLDSACGARRSPAKRETAEEERETAEEEREQREKGGRLRERGRGGHLGRSAQILGAQQVRG